MILMLKRELLVPISKMKRKGIWKDVTCTYTMKFQNGEGSVPFKVDVYGESYSFRF